MSAQTLYRSLVQQVKDGKNCIDEQFVLVGEKGIKIKYYHVKDNKKEKISITGKDGSYNLKKINDDVVVESVIDNKGLVAELKSSKLKFAKEYLKTVLDGGKPKKSKSSSKVSKTKSKKSKTSKK